MTGPRIVSLICSATEIVSALGFRDQLVGRSHECDHPTGVEALPPCTSPKFDVFGNSYEIDQRVKALVQEGLSVYRVDGDRLRELDPDVIVTQDQCEVCAASLKDVEAAVCDWTGRPARIVSLSPNRLRDVWGDIRRVAEALDVPGRGAALVERLEARMAAIAERAAGVGHRPRVATIEWVEPLMAAGNWIPQMVDMAGGANLFGETGAHSPWLEWDSLRAADPDVVVVMPCGFSIERVAADMPALEARPGWPDMKAVRGGRVILTDGHHFFNRPGPRLAESLEILAEILHPDLFEFGHEGTAWRVHRGA